MILNHFVSFWRYENPFSDDHVLLTFKKNNIFGYTIQTKNFSIPNRAYQYNYFRLFSRNMLPGVGKPRGNNKEHVLFCLSFCWMYFFVNKLDEIQYIHFMLEHCDKGNLFLFWYLPNAPTFQFRAFYASKSK